MATALESFGALGLSEATIKVLIAKGFEEPTPIQKKCIPLLLADNTNLVGQAQTGSGKTAAFGLPIIEVIDAGLPRVQALILTPTRELAVQVSEELHSLTADKRIRVASVYGGQPFNIQLSKLRAGAQIVVGTPGRVMEHLDRATLKLADLKFFILDEADEMLDMGFIEDVEKILTYAPTERRTLFFSATMPTRILQLAKKFMGKFQNITIGEQTLTVEQTDQIYFEVRNEDKFEALTRIIDFQDDFYGLIFCHTKIDVDTLVKRLQDRGYEAEAIHGDYAQVQREKTFASFKKRRFNILVATDVAARGLDVVDLSHVINFSLPQDAESYVHRIGRTGRAGKQGTAITFITPYEYRKLTYIKQTTKTPIRRGDIPNIAQIIDAKKKNFKNQIGEIIKKEGFTEFSGFAADLLEKIPAEQLVASLLKKIIQNDFDADRYQEIREAPLPVDSKGKNRLFIALGKLQDMTKAKLIATIMKESGVRNELIQEVQVYDNFSFISVPFAEGEIILKAFQHYKNGARPIVTRARAKTTSY
ncbi:RNA helicase [Candidatus Wirthbacteria bacterium CG2_30_54_11]|uniref:RNA helicase n=1 Tax=Candidatus Wirthbacteria bacterium CG2_30_54_11 TaxID=1817892 RepID=A0A1J5ILS1_9BACT|nr:MAG: RNA helicase [Candidatus Wirthbacteria bacterium CG2_30_54_11]